ncbi:MAG TPA: ATP-binding protein [Rhizomicrobium sp.]|nr:ATP-binding protein [Rhizomicrobium sp.]
MSGALRSTVQPDADASAPGDTMARAEFAGRIDFLYRIGRFYLFLPFGALCLVITLFERPAAPALMVTPFLLQIGATIAGFQLVRRYENRNRNDAPEIWARRYVFLSGISGGIWGVGALVWFVPHSFPAQAYLVLAFLGMAATEFIARAAYRPAYLTQASLSLGPLALMLFLDGNPIGFLTSILVIFFGGVLYSYCSSFGEMLDESIRLRLQNVDLVASLRREKNEAETARDLAQTNAHAKSAFIANISHEIRTPLNALLGMAQLLEQSELGHAQRNHVKVILEAGHGLKTLLDDVIALSRQDDSDAQAIEADCDAIHAARTVARLLQPRAWEKKLRLSVTAPAELLHAAGDPRRVRQILLKLADNGLKFTDAGGVDIAVSAQADALGDRQIRFNVTDTGSGIPREFAKELFEPFTPGDTSYTRRHQGAGLGLAVARQMVEAMGGAIGFESVEGEGSVFWFTLPVARAASSPRAEKEAAESVRPPSGLQLLVFAGDVRMREQLSHMLAPFGNRIAFADSASDAASRAGRERFDAIFVDSTSTDTLGASPGVNCPLFALVQPGMSVPVSAEKILFWPASRDELYAALSGLAATSNPARVTSGNRDAYSAAIDTSAFSALEKSLGLVTLIEILQSYTQTAEQLCGKLSDASQSGRWDEATRYAQDIAGAAGGLGLGALTQAARGFAQKAREGENAAALQTAAQEVMAEHERARSALNSLYPDLAA